MSRLTKTQKARLRLDNAGISRGELTARGISSSRGCVRTPGVKRNYRSVGHGGGRRYDFHAFAVEDELRVPREEELPAGDYVLGWRWDAEMTSQVWSSCADITIV